VKPEEMTRRLEHIRDGAKELLRAGPDGLEGGQATHYILALSSVLQSTEFALQMLELEPEHRGEER
jgi:hypothetical protein